MKTKIDQFISGCLALLVAAFFVTVFAPDVSGQSPAEEDWSIPVKGMRSDHQGLAAWDADGTGPEPYGVGHTVPIPGFTSYPYYGASCDYDGIDPDPNACLAHVEGTITGFPAFLQALEQHYIDPARITFKTGTCDLGDDLEGQDWFIIGNYTHAFYYDMEYQMYLDDELLLTWTLRNSDNYAISVWPYFIVESSYAVPVAAWGPSSSQAAQDLGQALLNDFDGEELRMIFYITDDDGVISGNGRTGGFWNVYSGTIEKGRPELPYSGLASEHQGMAGWNADGTGPEPPGDGHGAQRYYIASRDYGDIDPDPNAAFGHFLPEMKGFLNLNLQMAYRGYTPDQMLVKNGLSSLGKDVMGEDWGFANGTDYWCNYYDIDYILELDGEQVITGLVDTSLSWMNADPPYWWCEATYDLPRDGSAMSSDDVKIIAGAFMKDLDGRKMINDVQLLSYDTASFEGNGRYEGGYFNVESARLVAEYYNGCTFVQCDSLCSGFTNYTHWTEAHSPYLVDSDILIDQGHTLRIDSGVVVAFRGPYNINVNGSVMALGTEENGVLFTHSNPLVEWNSFKFEAPPDSMLSKFEYCTFEYSYSTKPFPFNSGGAISAQGFDNFSVSHCIFRYNRAEFSAYTNQATGGAIALDYSSPLIEYCIFHDNRAIYGGAMMIHGQSNPVIKYCLFRDNHASNDAGAIQLWNDSSPLIQNNTITGNTAGDIGGGIDIYFCHTDSVMLTSNIIFGNQCNGSALQQQVSFTSGLNVASFKHNDIEGGLAGIGATGPNVYYAASNINADPGFCEPEANIFTLHENSPCLTSGPGGTFIGAFDWGCWEGIAEGMQQSGGIQLYPNPVSGHVVSAAFTMQEPGFARLEIYNIAGEKVAEPFAGYFAGGDQQVVFNLEGLPAGIYIGRITAGGMQHTAKLAIIN